MFSLDEYREDGSMGGIRVLSRSRREVLTRCDDLKAGYSDAA
jgi:hypothetical protein